MQKNALCFGPGLPEAGAPCAVAVASDGLTVAFGDGPTERVSFGDITVGAGGLDGDHLVLTWPPGRTLYLKDRALIVAFRAAAPASLTGAINETAARVRAGRRRRRLFLWGSAGLLLALLLGLWLGFQALVTMAVAHVPVEWERPIGQAARDQFLIGQTVMSDGPAVEQTRAILSRLTTQMPETGYRFELTVVRSETINAFALPGGYVVVFTGLLKHAQGPDEVAGVLAHEVQHVVLRHGLERMVASLGLTAVVTILTGNEQGLVGLAKRLGLQLATLKFGRDQETAADVGGVRMLYRAHINPDAMVAFFLGLADRDPAQIELLSTHPMSAARAERLNAEIKALGPLEATAWPFDWSAARGSL